MSGDVEQRTEAPTPRRRTEARSKGQVARSHDLTAAVILFAAVVLLRLLGERVWISLYGLIESALNADHPARLADALPYITGSARQLLYSVGPVLAILFAVAIIVLFAQVGWLFTWQPLMPSLGKLNPLAGLMRLLSVRSAGGAAISVAKVIVVGTVAYVTVHQQIAKVLHAGLLDLASLVAAGGALMFGLCIRLSAAVLILALLDYAWQKYRHERDLRMTKEEVKDELRSMEGDPQIKRRRRQLQLQMAMRRLRKDVPNADVIVTNPTHFAIAIQYDADHMAAPKVVAKGVDYAAIRIRQIATEFGIPIVERRPLARALYDSVDVGQYIPEKFYRAIAEVLAYVYELTGRSPMGRPMADVA